MNTTVTETTTVPPFWVQLRANVLELLESHGMTRTQLAEAVEISPSTLNAKLRGDRPMWGHEFARIYATFKNDRALLRGLDQSATGARSMAR